MPLDGRRGRPGRRALAAEELHLVTVFAAYAGESYADIPTVQRTVGFIPAGHHAPSAKRARKELSDFAAALGWAASPATSASCRRTRRIPTTSPCGRWCGASRITRRATGRPSRSRPARSRPDVLLRFLQDVDRPNLRINFDPANMILYGTGDPIEALGVLAPHVVSVHCKDGDWPPEDSAGRARHGAARWEKARSASSASSRS